MQLFFIEILKFNTKRNKSYSVNRVGIYTGLVVSLNLSTTEQIYYHVGDNNVRPVFTEFNNIIQKKTIYFKVMMILKVKYILVLMNFIKNNFLLVIPYIHLYYLQ